MDRSSSQGHSAGAPFAEARNESSSPLASTTRPSSSPHRAPASLKYANASLTGTHPACDHAAQASPRAGWGFLLALFSSLVPSFSPEESHSASRMHAPSTTGKALQAVATNIYSLLPSMRASDRGIVDRDERLSSYQCDPRQHSRLSALRSIARGAWRLGITSIADQNLRQRRSLAVAIAKNR